jgi:penicillin-binding protein 2
MTPNERSLWTLRVSVLALAACAFFGILLFRAFWLQIVEGDHYAAVSESNAGQSRILRPPRGVILDRRGVVLATNRPSFDVVFLPRGVARDAYDEVAGLVAEWTAQDPKALLKIMLDARKRPFSPAVLAGDVSRRVISLISEQKFRLPGIQIDNRTMRNYPLGPAAAHLLGYIGEVSDAEIEDSAGYIMGDWIGRAGVEVALEDELAGVKGFEDVEVDALGQTIRRLRVRPPVAGNRVTLTVDADLQTWAHEAFAGRSGALVALEPATGRILALYSGVAYDPNVLVDRRRSAERAAYFTDTRLPLFNRALQSTYSPGSTFKTITMIAGLLTGRLKPSTRLSCGGIYAGMKCWKEGGHGSLDLVSAYQHSCNVYFYQAGERVWIEPLHEVASSLGLDRFPGFGVGPEAHGVVPTPEWERANVKGPDGEHWGTGDVRNTAIGQGYVSVSPAQMATVVSSAAMGGIRMRPSVVERVDDAEGNAIRTFEAVVESDLGLDTHAIETVRKAMRLVVDAGTGRRARVEGLAVGGKTGTAQNPQGGDHAWFIGAAPIDDPKIGVCVMLENAGAHGGTVAAPIAQYVLERYAKRERWIEP